MKVNFASIAYKSMIILMFYMAVKEGGLTPVKEGGLTPVIAPDLEVMSQDITIVKEPKTTIEDNFDEYRIRSIRRVGDEIKVDYIYDKTILGEVLKDVTVEEFISTLENWEYSGRDRKSVV